MTASFKTTCQSAIDRLVTDLQAVSAIKHVYAGPPDAIHEWPAAVLFEEWTEERHLNTFRRIVLDMHVQLLIAKVGEGGGTLDNNYQAVRNAAFDVMHAMDQDMTLNSLAQNSVWGTPAVAIRKLAYSPGEWYGADIHATYRFEGQYDFV